MEKNEVYDYLARIYLDKQPKAQEEKKGALRQIGFPVFLIVAVILFFSFYFIWRLPVRLVKPQVQSLQINAGSQLIRIKYNFNNSDLKRAGYSLNFADLDVSKFSVLGFQARHEIKHGPLNLRVEIENRRREKAVCYVRGISGKWNSFEIKLSDFSGISEWAGLTEVSFVVEEWNALNKEDTVYLDEIRFSRY
ncbi:MAG TPA: hypothetical protein VJA84_03060 [Candidatus Omnitrophota bacterium]|nr:hypothetical protein [Candidatus Omnitrophota bacterium]